MSLPPDNRSAPGWPGIPPRWTSSAKTGVGTALSFASRIWFTISHGILNEVYYPRVDQACIRDMGLIVTDGREFFSEEKRNARSEVLCPHEGVPFFHLINTCMQGRYKIEKKIMSDPRRDTLVQQIEFESSFGRVTDSHLYVLLSPHLGNRGADNTAWLGDYKGVPMLFACRNENALALACSCPWLRRSAGYVGFSDGWQDLTRNKVMTEEYRMAENGNVALTAEIDLKESGGRFVLSLGFGGNFTEAGNRALSSLMDGFEEARREYVRGWRAWQDKLRDLRGQKKNGHIIYRVSTSVLRIHESKRFLGGMIASLSIPWGFSKGDDDLGGYHLAWPRDLVETAGGLLAAGAHSDVHRVLHYLHVTQEPDGHWPQNMWLDGTPYWSGIQMDEAAFPVLLVDMAKREGALSKDDVARLWPMVRMAASFIARNGPVTQQDRWEEDPGYSPFTLAVEIAALLAAADLAEFSGEEATASYLRETADNWNINIERWIYRTGTDLARQTGVEGYYVRIAPPEFAEASSPKGGFVPIKNRPAGPAIEPADDIVSPDALALVRFGLRSPDDPRIVNTVKVIDALLKTDTPFGPAWRRYNNDQYGENDDGSPFNGTGRGRPWPLLTGERAHYELAAGRREAAERLCEAMVEFSNEGGMIPEQIWDSPDIPERELFFGKPSGSAMPLVWAHAEYIKLLRSLAEGRVFDMPPQTVQRYRKDRTGCPYSVWRFNQKIRTMDTGAILRVEVLAQATVHWSSNDWKNVYDSETKSTGLGIYITDLPVSDLKDETIISFTFYWHDSEKWEGQDFEVRVAGQREV